MAKYTRYDSSNKSGSNDTKRSQQRDWQVRFEEPKRQPINYKKAYEGYFTSESDDDE
jgi:hypothetical protein